MGGSSQFLEEVFYITNFKNQNQIFLGTVFKFLNTVFILLRCNSSQWGSTKLSTSLYRNGHSAYASTHTKRQWLAK
jgi:hypothetical protein